MVAVSIGSPALTGPELGLQRTVDYWNGHLRPLL